MKLTKIKERGSDRVLKISSKGDNTYLEISTDDPYVLGIQLEPWEFLKLLNAMIVRKDELDKIM